MLSMHVWELFKGTRPFQSMPITLKLTYMGHMNMLTNPIYLFLSCYIHHKLFFPIITFLYEAPWATFRHSLEINLSVVCLPVRPSSFLGALEIMCVSTTTWISFVSILSYCGQKNPIKLFCREANSSFRKLL